MSTPDCGLAVYLRGKRNGLDRTKQQTKNIKLAVIAMPGHNARPRLASLELVVVYSLKDSLNLPANSYCNYTTQLLNFTLCFNV